MKKEEILKKLRESKDYISGQELCEFYGVSRTAVWKAIKQLEKEGYNIEAVTNKGYRLVDDNTTEADVMSQVSIESYIDTKWAGKNFVFNKETGSTNQDVKLLAEKGAVAGTLVVADSQLAGRGRRGRDWISPPGKDIYMSLLLRPSCMPDRASSLTLVMALSVLEAIDELEEFKNKCSIKWPNDIVINGKKICGILTEMSAEIEAIHYVVVGVGINVNQTQFEEEIKKTATSLLLESDTSVNRSKLIARIMHYFEINYAIFEQSFDLEGLVEKYNRFLVNLDRQVRVLDPKGEFEGVAKGINEKGELIVKRSDNGEEVLVYAGEVSVRGIYGYV